MIVLAKKSSVEIGKKCESGKMHESEKKGNTVIPWSRGADFLEITPAGKLTFKEVKKNCEQPLSKFQQKFKAEVEKIGFGYEKEYCSCERTVAPQ